MVLISVDIYAHPTHYPLQSKALVYMNLQSCNFPGTISLELLCHLKKWIRFWIGCVKAHPWAYTTPLVKDQAVFKLYNVCKSNLANFPGITSLELLYHLKKWIRFWIGCINDCPRAYTTPLVKDLAVFTMYNVRICNLLEIYIYTIWIPAYSKIAWKCMLRDAHWYNLSKTGFTL